MNNLKCPVCGKDLKVKYSFLTCECGWMEPTEHKPMATSTTRAHKSMKY